jgi:hypothetical protein
MIPSISHLRTITSLAIVSLALSACTTEIGADGQPHKVMTPMGAAVVQGVTAAGIGAGTGALMRGVNPVAAGAISAGAGSVGSQAINAFIPQAGKGSATAPAPSQNQQLYVRSSDGSFIPAKVSYIQQADGSYVPSYSRGQQLYRQLPNGSFAPVR